jgi:hypothetical protein
MPGCRPSCSAASMFMVGSSRITVCGQAPASTASTRFASMMFERRSRSASSDVTRSLVMTETDLPIISSSGISLSTSAVLPDPTGPPIPTRAAGPCGAVVSVCVTELVLPLVIAACTSWSRAARRTSAP